MIRYLSDSEGVGPDFVSVKPPLEQNYFVLSDNLTISTPTNGPGNASAVCGSRYCNAQTIGLWIKLLQYRVLKTHVLQYADNQSSSSPSRFHGHREFFWPGSIQPSILETSSSFHRHHFIVKIIMFIVSSHDFSYSPK